MEHVLHDSRPWIRAVGSIGGSPSLASNWLQTKTIAFRVNPNDLQAESQLANSKLARIGMMIQQKTNQKYGQTILTSHGSMWQSS